MYKTELHLHSHEVSPCCDLPTEETARRYREAGYRTVTVTDHLTKAVTERSGPWADTVEWFMSGYHAFCDCLRGDIHVLFGFELRLEEHPNDYLVYGLGRDFLLASRGITAMPRREAAKLIHEAGGLLYAAHPFRNNMTVLPPDGLDGVEVFNAHGGHDSRNELAYAYAKRYGLHGIAGTDFHHPYHFPAAGILTEKEIRSEKDLLSVLREGSYRTFGQITE